MENIFLSMIFQLVKITSPTYLSTVQLVSIVSLLQSPFAIGEKK